MLLNHSEDVEGDLARWYPNPDDQLTAFYDGRMSPRRLWVLVSKLPQQSHCARILHGDIVDWTIDTTILARMSNILLQANSPKKVPESQLIQPPKKQVGRTNKPTKPATVGGAAELDALFTGGR